MNSNEGDSNQNSTSDQNASEDASNYDSESVNQNRPKKFEKNFNRQQAASQIASATSKMAKFSSLFKNNHEIPRVGE